MPPDTPSSLLPQAALPSPSLFPSFPLTSYLEGAVCSPCFAEGRNSQSPDCHSCYSPEAQCVSLWPGVDIKGDRCETDALVWDRSCRVSPQQSSGSRESLTWASGHFWSPLPVSRTMPDCCQADNGIAGQSSRLEPGRPRSILGSHCTKPFQVLYELKISGNTIVYFKSMGFGVRRVSVRSWLRPLFAVCPQADTSVNSCNLKLVNPSRKVVRLNLMGVSAWHVAYVQ